VASAQAQDRANPADEREGAMGDSASRSFQACCDPEGTANIVRKKKAQRACLNRYQEILNQLEQALQGSDRGWVRDTVQDLTKYDREVQAKGEGQFWPELQEHKDYPPIDELRSRLLAQARALDPGAA
ncbi:unnamed protein product, partial [Prorocentrum cordatum]